MNHVFQSIPFPYSSVVHQRPYFTDNSKVFAFYSFIHLFIYSFIHSAIIILLYYIRFSFHFQGFLPKSLPFFLVLHPVAWSVGRSVSRFIRSVSFSFLIRSQPRSLLNVSLLSIRIGLSLSCTHVSLPRISTEILTQTDTFLVLFCATLFLSGVMLFLNFHRNSYSLVIRILIRVFVFRLLS